MTYGAQRPHAAFRNEARSRQAVSPMVVVLVALAVVASAALLYAMLPSDRATDAPNERPSERLSDRPSDLAPRGVASLARPLAPAPNAARADRRTAKLLDPSFMAPAFTAGYRAVTFAQSVLPQSGLVSPSRGPAGEAAASAVADIDQSAVMAPLPALAEARLPAPPSRFVLSGPASDIAAGQAGRRRMARRTPEPLVASDPPGARGVFDRLFGAAGAPSSAMAYAAPDDTGLGAFAARTAPDRYTAVYDIAAHTVTLPDGTRLEAHSGLGPRLDDPRSVAEHMRGATPPAVYDLEPREALFHGVRALRLNPVGGAPYGRLGLLAHSYMLGPRGDSNGCVVFRDYQAFRRAFDQGQVRRLVVVATRV